MQELVPAMMCVESSKVRRLLIEMDVPEAVLSIQLTEVCNTIEAMRYLFKGGSLVVLLNNGLVQVLWIKADMKGTIRLAGIGKRRHPLGKLGDRCYHPLCDHVIEDALYLLSVLYGYPPSGMLDGGYIRVGPDGIGTGHVANCVK